MKKEFPGLPVHASTQMTVTGPKGAALLEKAGVSRIVTARELSLEEIRKIHEEIGMEIEVLFMVRYAIAIPACVCSAVCLGEEAETEEDVPSPADCPTSAFEAGKALNARKHAGIY